MTSSQIEGFYEKGWFVIPQLFTLDEINEMRQSFDELQSVAFTTASQLLSQPGVLNWIEGGFTPSELPYMYKGSQIVYQKGEKYQDYHQGNHQNVEQAVSIRRIMWCGAAQPPLLRYGGDARILKIAGAVLGAGVDKVSQLVNQAHYKIPGDGIAFDWHQDSQFRGYGQPWWKDVNGKGSFVQTITALDDMNSDNGGMMVIPGSCKKGHIGLDKMQRSEWTKYFDEGEACALDMKAGDVMFFGPYTIHGSLPNTGKDKRRIFINGYALVGANSREYIGEGSRRILDIPH